MSVVVIITPIIVGGWPIFSALASAAATRLGFKLQESSRCLTDIDKEKEIVINDDTSTIIEDALRTEEELTFTKEGITVICKKDVHDNFTICARGKNKSDHELSRIGQSFLNKVKQQYAYQRVMEEMKNRGFNVIQEENEGQRIKIVMRRH